MLTIEERLELLEKELENTSREDLEKELRSYESKGPSVYEFIKSFNPPKQTDEEG